MDFLQSIDWMEMLRCFVVGGLICIIGQILIDKTKLTSARILVIFVTTGVILGALGIYKYVIDFAGCGATVPLLGFGANLVKGAITVLVAGFFGSSFLSLLTMKRMPRISSTTPIMIRMIPIRKYRSTLSSIQYEVGIAHVAEA